MPPEEIPPPAPPAPDFAKQIADLAAKNVELAQKLEALSKPPTPKPDDPGLLEKARLQKEEADKKSNDSKRLESALKFSMGADDFLKTNQSLLPKDIGEIFKLAEKENYDNAIQKASAIKSNVVQSFFKVQANLDLLTPGLKEDLDDYLKLTKDGKEENAQKIYHSVFEPAFEMLKRIKKAEVLARGFGNEGDLEMAYKNKLIKGARSHYLGEK